MNESLIKRWMKRAWVCFWVGVLVGVLGLWVRSYFVAEELALFEYIRTKPGHKEMLSVATAPGMIAIRSDSHWVWEKRYRAYKRRDHDPELQKRYLMYLWSREPRPEEVSWQSSMLRLMFFGSESIYSGWGIVIGKNVMVRGPRISAVLVPMAYPATLAALPLLFEGWRLRRRWRRRKRGLCRECGYDLRGSSSEKCSECGTVIDRGASTSC